MDKLFDGIKDLILDIEEEKLKSQLKTIRKLRGKDLEEEKVVLSSDKSMSQIEMVYNILYQSKTPMHITDIIDKIKELYGKDVDRESIVSSLVKKVAKNDCFCRTGKNTFSLAKGGK